uniref:Protein kinase domain-containing protein n=1 Tax=Panagrolaimus sp. JU765 TaxID=591449 RepID=A0AC34RIW8_9BILA
MSLDGHRLVMPLGGLFGGGNSNGPKPQPLQNENKKEKREKGSISSSKDLEKDCKGMSVKINKKSYTIEKKLGEGGFAIVFLVYDKHNRYYAMKRQLIRDDPRQLEACKVEAQIVKNLSGHKNLIAYIDHQLTLSKTGVYDSILLTVYYKTSVLQLMNSRVVANKWLLVDEILDIFCDMCEAVARLHHSKTPVCHRDLKLENILIDQRSGSEKPVYVLCDFGSATTKVLSRDTHTIEQMEDEIKRYTTLSYRAPEMVDLFSGVPIGTKSDIWALGIMLYKLCYFALPFGESALAIQNGSFSFPDIPPIPEEIKAIISFLLTQSAVHRPNIFQTSYLAFSAANRKCPVFNIQRSPRIELLEAVKIFRMRDRLGANYAKALEKAMNEAYSNTLGGNPSFSPITEADKTMDYKDSAPVSFTTVDSNIVHSNSSNNPFLQPDLEAISSMVFDSDYKTTTTSQTLATTTSVNPRLRPKPAVKVNMNQSLATPFAMPLLVNTSATPKTVPSAESSNKVFDPPPFSNPNFQPNQVDQVVDTMKISHISTESSKSAPERDVFSLTNVPKPTLPSMPASPFATTAPPINSQSLTSNLKSSAFKPYSMTNRSQINQLEKLNSFQSSKNPFTDYAANNHGESPSIMDDNAFGERFDELPRVTKTETTHRQDFQPNLKVMQLILNDEPFSQAPFNAKQVYDSKSDFTRVL